MTDNLQIISLTDKSASRDYMLVSRVANCQGATVSHCLPKQNILLFYFFITETSAAQKLSVRLKTSVPILSFRTKKDFYSRVKLLFLGLISWFVA